MNLSKKGEDQTLGPKDDGAGRSARARESLIVMDRTAPTT